ncbi:threonyl-tRNA synthetase editing domain-containing protein [Sulfurisphaera ohwakuensis]|uniref:threonyl-tRNA synthetase editing domain-containing protein n=1 Tax=Sulfurisphaera ohwakuensis TaxID=69656 RepID=UPI0036F2BF8C
MILLFIHASDFSFSIKEKAIKNPEEPKLQSLKKENVLVVFTTVEKGDDEEIVKKAVDEILEVYSKVKASSVVIYPYAHLSDNLESPSIAIPILQKLEEGVKERNIEVYRTPFGWYKQFMINCYGHPLSELSKRIRHEIEYEKSDELSICEKFGFPNSPYAYFLRNAILEYVKWLSKATSITEDEDVEEGEISIKYLEPHGRRLPCINESPHIKVKVKGKIDIVSQFSDSKNSYKIVEEKEEYSEVDVNLLTYYYLLSAQKESPPTLPIWLSPIQVRILPVKQDFIKNAIEIASKINGRVDVDDLPDGLGAKIARAGKDWIPYVVILGEREIKTLSLTVKIRKRNEQRSYTIEELNEELNREDPLKMKSNFPLLLSQRSKKYIVSK